MDSQGRIGIHTSNCTQSALTVNGAASITTIHSESIDTAVIRATISDIYQLGVASTTTTSNLLGTWASISNLDVRAGHTSNLTATFVTVDTIAAAQAQIGSLHTTSAYAGAVETDRLLVSGLITACNVIDAASIRSFSLSASKKLWWERQQWPRRPCRSARSACSYPCRCTLGDWRS